MGADVLLVRLGWVLMVAALALGLVVAFTGRGAETMAALALASAACMVAGMIVWAWRHG